MLSHAVHGSMGTTHVPFKWCVWFWGGVWKILVPFTRWSNTCTRKVSGLVSTTIFFSFFLSLSSSNFMPAPAKFQTNPFNFFPSHSTLSFWFVFRISYKITNKFHTYHFFLSINNLSNYNFFSISTPIIYIYISNYKCFSISPLWFF